MVVFENAPRLSRRVLSFMMGVIALALLAAAVGCGSRAWRVIECGGAVNRAWYAGGSGDRLLVADNKGARVVRPDGTVMAEIGALGDAAGAGLAVSPDGKTVFYTERVRSTLPIRPGATALRRLDLPFASKHDIASVKGDLRSYLADPLARRIALVAKLPNRSFQLSLLDVASRQTKPLTTEAKGIIACLGWCRNGDVVRYAVERDDGVLVFECRLDGHSRLIKSLPTNVADSVSGTPLLAADGAVLYATNSGKLVVTPLSGSSRVIDLKKAGLSVLGVTQSRSGRYVAVSYYSDSNECGFVLVDLTTRRTADIAVKSKARMLPSIEFAEWHPHRDRMLCLYKNEARSELREYDAPSCFR